ncbi:hypothetical protein GCM10023169_14370 [Georgenia halophila]|uniref:Nudix hydrolase domain-containing protein n=1 Tax=Georgenia halophila TaxID=620889 RepID=A0ABP8L2F5_9MICO
MVVVRKSRGPYLGLLDLPGESPESGESPEKTLVRELLEECGVRPARFLSWHEFDLGVDRDSAGRTIDLRHRGRIALVEVTDAVAEIRDVEDVAAVERHRPEDLDENACSAPLSFALGLLPRPDGQE